MKENISKFQKIVDRHKRIFILGTGSSLLEIPDYILIKLKDEFTIGISYLYKIFMPNCIIWGDQVFTDVIYKQNFDVDPVFIMSSIAYDKQRYVDRIDFRIWLDSMVDYKFDVSKLKGHLTSAWLLQILKDYQGEIYLIGFDFYEGHSYTEKEIGYDPSKSWVTNNPVEAVKQHEGFKMKIFNCNPDSLLKEYPYKDLKEVLN